MDTQKYRSRENRTAEALIIVALLIICLSIAVYAGCRRVPVEPTLPPTLTSTATLEPPTATPEPTETLEPTDTPVITEPPITSTPEPTDTEVPTLTNTPTQTEVVETKEPATFCGGWILTENGWEYISRKAPPACVGTTYR